MKHVNMHYQLFVQTHLFKCTCILMALKYINVIIKNKIKYIYTINIVLDKI